VQDYVWGIAPSFGITKKKSANLLSVVKKAGDRFIISGCFIKIDKLLNTKLGGQRVMLKYSSIISTCPEIMGGTPVFTGTRVPVQTLLDYLKAGESIDDFLDGLPTVTREQVIALLEVAVFVIQISGLQFLFQFPCAKYSTII
jgi:uncharacterized protein (DUF433 family)